MANVERNTAIPLYLQIAEDIKSKIKKEELKANSRIPTELELSEFLSSEPHYNSKSIGTFGR